MCLGFPFTYLSHVMMLRCSTFTKLSLFPFVCSLSEDDKVGTLDELLSNAYCRSQRFLSKQLAHLRPELTMSIFSGELRRLAAC